MTVRRYLVSDEDPAHTEGLIVKGTSGPARRDVEFVARAQAIRKVGRDDDVCLVFSMGSGALLCPFWPGRY